MKHHINRRAAAVLFALVSTLITSCGTGGGLDAGAADRSLRSSASTAGLNSGTIVALMTDASPAATVTSNSSVGPLATAADRPALDSNGPVAVTGEHIGDVADPKATLPSPAPAWVGVVNREHVVIGFTKTSEDFVTPVDASPGDKPPAQIAQAIYGEDGKVIGHFENGQPKIDAGVAP